MLRRRACFTSWTAMVSFAMNDYHHFNNHWLLKDRFEKLDKIAADKAKEKYLR